MDLIRELKDVRFELNLRGYDCDAVDAFLAKVRSEIAELESEREADQSRIAALEAQVSGGESDTEGTLRRTLILAQRLADETVADARKSAAETTEAAEAEAAETRSVARADADEMRASAEHDAEQIRREADAELAAAREAAEQLRLEAATAAEQTRELATEEARRLLEAAEAAGSERVAALESAAQDEVASMREPIRTEVRRLEETRSQLRADIAALDSHLVEQRTRVRDAVASLRQGMSGSIDDLERVASDEALMTPVASPETSSVSAHEVTPAPDIDIVAGVAAAAASAPTVTELSQQAAAEAAEALDHGETESTVTVDEPVEETVDEIATSEPAEQAPASVVGADDDTDDVAADVDDTEMLPIVEPETTPDEGPHSGAEPVDLVAGVGAPGAAVVDLDDEPSALFETEVAADQTIVEAASTEVVAADAAEGIAADSEEPDADEAPSEVSLGFVERFSAAIGEVPISSRQ